MLGSLWVVIKRKPTYFRACKVRCEAFASNSDRPWTVGNESFLQEMIVFWPLWGDLAMISF